jgi:hypothetical protein
MKKVVIALTLALAAIGMMVAVVTYAQGPEGEPTTPPEEPGAGEISTFSLNLPPGPGQTVLYMFTGAADNQNTGNPTIATVVICTNISPVANQLANVEVQIVTRDSLVSSATKEIFPGQTVTFSTRDTAVYDDSGSTWSAIINLGSRVISQGSGRVLASTSGSTQVICTVKVVDPANNPPRFEARLPLYTSTGTPIDGINLNRLYLPLIFK